ncbi:hypothetical protein SDC9_138970 [bioreactor metagenome]|uniref:Uncharacterized protein n=1 Tax=bioreactor metagenome TaxID=1076179 RepID=A0A645DRA0_9ZZZZ
MDRVRRHLQPFGVDVDQHDGAGPVHPPGDPDVHAADRAGAEDDDDVALLDADLLLGVDRAGERLGRRGLVVADAVGDPVEAVDLEDLGRHDHVLGETAVVLVADRGLVLTDLHPALPALVALPAGDGGDRLHPVADREAAQCVRPDLDHLAGHLVTHRRGAGDVRVPVVVDLDVGAAGGAVPDPDLHLIGSADRLRHILDPDVLGGVEAQRLHRLHSPSSGASSSITSSGLVALRSFSALAGSASTPARAPRMPTCSSLLDAIGMATYTV